MARRLLLLSIGLVLLLLQQSSQAPCYQAVSKADYPYCRQMDANSALHWSLGNDSATFAIQIDQASGWFGLGLSEGGGMRGADMHVFTKSGDAWSVKDYWSLDYVTPTEDALQDGELVSTQQSGGTTVAVFTRKFDTCDMDADQIIHPNFRQPWIFAYGPDSFGYHGTTNRGTMFLTLNATTSSEAATPGLPNTDEDTRQLPVVMTNYTVPAQVTSYTCLAVKAPSDTTYHLISTNYTITPNKMVHHMLVLACDSVPDMPLGQTFDCPSLPKECSNLWLVWVPGQDPEEMPPNTGYRMGKGAPQYLMIQIHYTNPDLTPGVQDNSGFVVNYTPKLRPYDLAVMWLGTEGFEIPPGEELAGIPPSVCPSECTSRLNQSVNLVASEFHMHQLGARQTAQHLRPLADGSFEEIAPLNYRQHYDFSWQGGTFILPGSDTLSPGSALITTCWWNTKSQKNTTYFGLSSYDEMCYNFLRYWPATKIDRCMQLPGTEQNGTALAQCANQGDMLRYMARKNITDFTPEIVMDLLQQGFLVQFNTTPYKDFKPYNRTTPQCAATLAARQQQSGQTPAAPAPTTPAPGSKSTSGAAAAAASSVTGLLSAVAMLGMLLMSLAC